MWIKLKEITESKEFKQILSFLKSELKANNLLAPSKDYIFRVFNELAYEDVRVVILGQDPYPTKGHANGLAFATNASETPKSLQNIFKEIESEFGVKPKNNNLLNWQKQGVLLLNTSLSTIEGQTFAHKDIWQPFTDQVIKALNESDTPIVFMLWGKPAQEKKKFITNSRHLILEAPHPSPLSAYRGFLGSNIFKNCNEFLKKNKLIPIDWTKS